jgi:hypothetical protein
VENSARETLDSFDRSTEPDRRPAASQVPRRILRFDSPPLEDETFIEVAEELFLQLDTGECAVRS